MRIERFTNRPPETPYAPSWDFSIGDTFIPLDLDQLAKTCLEKEKEIKKLPLLYYDTAYEGGVDKGKKLFDGYTGLGKNSTTSRSSYFNVLKWDTPETNLLKEKIRLNVNEYNKQLGNSTSKIIIIQCWVNILRFGQKINTHLHQTGPHTYLSGHYCVQAEDTSTCYINPVNVINDPFIIERKNNPGTFTIFPSYVPHYTTRHYSFKPRITLAMDILLDKEIADNWIEL